MNVLVTGASGFAGGRLVKALTRRGHHVRALVRRTSNTSALERSGAEIHVGDVRDRQAVDDAVHGADQVYHLAAVRPSPGLSNEFYRDVNVSGTRNVMRAVRHHGVERLIHCSTAGVHG